MTTRKITKTHSGVNEYKLVNEQVYQLTLITTFENVCNILDINEYATVGDVTEYINDNQDMFSDYDDVYYMHDTDYNTGFVHFALYTYLTQEQITWLKLSTK